VVALLLTAPTPFRLTDGAPDATDPAAAGSLKTV
jgi:hypothetical protein